MSEEQHLAEINEHLSVIANEIKRRDAVRNREERIKALYDAFHVCFRVDDEWVEGYLIKENQLKNLVDMDEFIVTEFREYEYKSWLGKTKTGSSRQTNYVDLKDIITYSEYLDILYPEQTNV